MGAGSDILAELRQVRADLAEIKALLLRGGAGGGASSSGPAPGSVAPDSDLDSQHGDVEIKKDPPRWRGEQLAPIRMSHAPADYLEEVASFKDWQAEQEEGKGTPEGKKKAGYCRKDAARARGWAARARAAAGDEL